MNQDPTKTTGGEPAWPPEVVRQFIEAATVAGDMGLPFHYPALDELEGWQSGFRYHGITGEDLAATTPGAWQPGWVVIALNGFDDPFFIDIGEQAQGFPVYYAPHGAGRWDAMQVAPDIDRFGKMLSALRDLQDDDAKAMRYIEAETDLANALWLEVHENRRNRPAIEQELAQYETPRNPEDWQHGTLILTDAGPQRVKVAQVLRQMLDLSLQEALAFAAEPDAPLAEGYRLHLRDTQSCLMALGAAVTFRPDEAMHKTDDGAHDVD
ncbi:SMI1/KNR4 family protein [Pseudomonas aeruginosa]|uniref:SMI1/KNR4 family protein n=1 Tax=Pseudomonas aeruginosa TaxID=287 RepID=UPI0037552751